jgi:hypothetical protein
MMARLGVYLVGECNERYRLDVWAAANGRPTSLTRREETSARHIPAFRSFVDKALPLKSYRADRDPHLKYDARPEERIVHYAYQLYAKQCSIPNREDFQTFFERLVVDAAAFSPYPFINPEAAAELWRNMDGRVAAMSPQS